MKINNKYMIYKALGDAITTNLIDGKENTYQTTHPFYRKLDSILSTSRKRGLTVAQKNSQIRDTLTLMNLFTDEEIEERLLPDVDISSSMKKVAVEDLKKIDEEQKKNIVTVALQKLINFFSGFNFTPSFRFVNSFVLSNDPITYVNNYFEVQDHPYKNEIKETTKSEEFKAIIKSLSGFVPKPINTRFELYYGEPGTGKTTKAYEICEGRMMVCSSDMLPADLMQNFCFKDGKADFDPSDLWKAMVEGKKIALDEVNMLPFESLRFLQGITDGKESFDYKGHTIKIHPNFKIYATMNLNVNGQCIPLPAPLVDRSYEIKEFKITAKDLVSAVLNFDEVVNDTPVTTESIEYSTLQSA